MLEVGNISGSGNEVRTFYFFSFQYALSNEPEQTDFDAAIVAVQPYDDYNYQSIYFVVQDFQNMQENFE